MKTKIPALFILCSILCFASTLSSNPFVWNGTGGDGNWLNLDNWNPQPNFSASNVEQNAFIFEFSQVVQMQQNMGNVQRRFHSLNFSAGSFQLENGLGALVFGSGGGGIIVSSGDHQVSAGAFNINVYVNNSVGGLIVNNGSLTLTVNDGGAGYSITGSSALRYLPVEGNGTITLNGKMNFNTNGGTIRLRENFSGRLVLNTEGSTIGVGSVEHRGTGVLQIGADDALGTLTLRFENDGARVESGNGARVIQNNVVVDSGFALTGDRNMEFSGGVNFTGNHQVRVDDVGAELVMSGSISGSIGEVTKSGEGTWRLKGDHSGSWSQGIGVHEGTLYVDTSVGSATGSGDLYIAQEATLTGVGGIGGNVNIAGELLLGDSGALVFENSVEFNSAMIHYGSDSIAAAVEGDLLFGQDVVVKLDSASSFEIGETYRLFDVYGGTITGELELAGGYIGDFAYQAGENGYVEFTLIQIPEPGTLGIAVLGLLGAARMIRRKTSK